MPTITQEDHDRLDLASGYPDAGYGVRIWSTTALVALAAQREAHEAKLATLSAPPSEPASAVPAARRPPPGLWRNLAMAALLAMSVASLVLLLKIYNQGMRAQLSRTEIGVPTAAMAIVSPTPPIVEAPAPRMPARTGTGTPDDVAIASIPASVPASATVARPAPPARQRQAAAHPAPEPAAVTADARPTARRAAETPPVPATIADTFAPPDDEPRVEERRRVRTTGIDALHQLRMR